MRAERRQGEAAAVGVWAIVPAAGRSRRMGRPKQTLAYAGSTLAATVVNNVLLAGVNGVVVVTRSSLVHDLELPDDDRVTVVHNDDAAAEMIDSIRIGLATLVSDRESEAGAATMSSVNLSSACANVSAAAGGYPITSSSNDGILVVPADQPAIPVATYRCCVQVFKEQPTRIVIAACCGKRGHPIIFPVRWHHEVQTLRGGLNQLASRHAPSVMLVETSRPDVLDDVDTPEQYARLSPKRRHSSKTEPRP